MVSKLTDKQIEIDDLQKKHLAQLADVQRSLSEKDGALGILRESVSQKESLCKQHEEKVSWMSDAESRRVRLEGEEGV